MLLKSDIEAAYESQRLDIAVKENAISRKYLNQFDATSSHIEIVSGVRRCGKSTLLLQLIQQKFSDSAYFNFEEPQTFGFEKNDFNKLFEIMGNKCKAYFFDEIQIVEGWEIFIRSLHDKGKKIFITGSNASMLSKELGTRLTGRHLQHELFPFSYSEFLDYLHLKNNNESFINYLNTGGFPEYICQRRKEILHQLFRDILYRDIAIRYGIKHNYELEQIGLFLLSNVAKETSFNSLKKILDFASTTTVSDFVGWFQDSYLLFLVPRFSYSAKSMMINPKKVYAIDTGLIKANTLSKSDDVGRLLENAVFLHFRRTKFRINYFKEKGECDFILFDKNKFVGAIQVCVVVSSDNRNREINGLVDALNCFDHNQGTIITLNQEDTLIEQGKTIHIIPAWKYFTKPS
jgi:predicted AAA+ superfamily ATPase